MLEGTLKKANQALTEPTPGIALKLEEPFHLKVAVDSPHLVRKGQVKLKITAERNPAFKGEISLACSQLPKGIKVPPVKLAAGKSEQELVVSASPEAAAGTLKNVKVVAQAKVGNGSFSTKVPLPGVAVEFRRAEGVKCARSWRIQPDVGADRDYPDVTPRDARALREWDAAHGAGG